MSRRREIEPADLSAADIAAVTDITGLAPEAAFDTLVLRRCGVYALNLRRRETLREPIETAARAIGARIGWDGDVWGDRVSAAMQRARLTALRLSRACGIG